MLRDEKEKRRRLEEKRTRKGNVMSKVVGQQYEPNQEGNFRTLGQPLLGEK
jgi:hypothetical protein